MTSINRILRIDASARKIGSVTRSLTDETKPELDRGEGIPSHQVFAGIDNKFKYHGA